MKRNETILLVDDEDELRNLFSEALMDSGYTVVTAANGREAVNKLTDQGGNIDLLVTDVIMPEMNGTELVAWAQNRLPNLRILFVSGHVDNKLGLKGAELLQKPFDMTVFVNRVKKVLTSGDAEA